MAIDEIRPAPGDDSSSSSRSHSRLSFGRNNGYDSNENENENDTAVIDAALDRALQGASPTANPVPDPDPDHHPYLSRRTMSKTNFEAEYQFVNAMFDSQTPRPASSSASESNGAGAGAGAGAKWLQPSPGEAHLPFGGMLHASPQTGPTTPRSILMSQKLAQAHSDAVLPQLSPRMPHLSVDLQTMPPLTLDSQAGSAGTASMPAATRQSASSLTISDLPSGSALDEEIIGQRLEKEIRKMMIRTHLTDEAPELAGMNEGPQELKRIGDSLARCIALRTKYMGLSLQREADNPRNARDWKIYPPAPPPAWRNFHEPSDSVSVEFDMHECAIPRGDGCVFAMGDDGVYAVYGSEDDRVSGAEPISKAP
ncbi:AMP deaminase, partial [Coemansia erecta]